MGTGTQLGRSGHFLSKTPEWAEENVGEEIRKDIVLATPHWSREITERIQRTERRAETQAQDGGDGHSRDCGPRWRRRRALTPGLKFYNHMLATAPPHAGISLTAVCHGAIWKWTKAHHDGRCGGNCHRQKPSTRSFGRSGIETLRVCIADGRKPRDGVARLWRQG